MKKYLQKKWYEKDFNKIATLESYGTFNKDFKVKTVDAVNYKGKNIRFIEKKSVLKNVDLIKYLINSRLYGFEQYGYTRSELYQIKDDCYSQAYIMINEYKGEYFPVIKTITSAIKREVRFYYGRREVEKPNATSYNVITSGLEVYSHDSGVEDKGLYKILSDYNLRNFILEAKNNLSDRQVKAIQYASGLTDKVEYLYSTDKEVIKNIAQKYFKD